MRQRRIDWPHAPVHQLGSHGTFFVTASTYLRRCHFSGAQRLEVLHRGLLAVATQFAWHLEAWAVFANHYHFVGHSPPGEEGADSLRPMLSRLHEDTAKWINKLEGTTAEKIWFNYWDKRLTFQKSYLARLSYVHQNAVKHRLVKVANEYPWCSAAWFEQTATKSQIETIYSFDGTKLKEHDDFSVESDW